MDERTDQSGEFVRPKKVGLLFLLTSLAGPLIGLLYIDILGATAGYWSSISVFSLAWIFAYVWGAVPAVISASLVSCVVIISQKWSVRLLLALVSGFLATVLFAVVVGSIFQDAEFVLLSGGIGALAAGTCVVLWRSLGGV